MVNGKKFQRHKHVCTYVHRHTQACTNTQTHKNTHASTHVNTHMHTPKHTQTHRETQTHIEYCTFNIVLYYHKYCATLLCFYH